MNHTKLKETLEQCRRNLKIKKFILAFSVTPMAGFLWTGSWIFFICSFLVFVKADGEKIKAQGELDYWEEI